MRAQSRRLVTIGACATAGGIQALRNFADVEEFISVVYATPEYISTLETSTPIAANVHVDFELHGCPVNKHQLLEVISAFLNERKPGSPATASAWSASGRGNVCVMVAHGTPAWGRSRTPAAARSARLRPRLLRLLRADGVAEHGVARRLARRARDGRGRRVRVYRTFNTRASRSAPRARGSRRMAENGETRTIRTEALARVEGEGAMHVKLRGDEVEDVELEIYEPPRFFEAFLRGRAFTEAPTSPRGSAASARSPTMTSACHAMEDALGVEVDERSGRCGG